MNHLLSLAEILAIPDPKPRLALDRSTRRIDADGHLHVGPSIISAAGVSSYWGSECPDFEKLGLRPNTEYRLFRPPDELRKAAPSFQNKPLLSLHRPISATDHAPSLVVGAIGSPVTFDGRDLMAPLVVWDSAAIEAIEDGSVRSLSCGYRYKAVPQSGSFGGDRYTLVMTDIVGNHCALVDAGRVPGAMVGDAALRDNAINGLPVRRNAMDDDDERRDPTRLQQFLASVLSGDDLATANTMLNELISDPDATIAEDAMRRRVAQARLRPNAAMDKRFPGLGRLKHRPF